MPSYLLTIDQGTSSSRAIIFTELGETLSQAQRELTQHYPQDGWVEHDGEEIWQSTLETCRLAIAQAKLNAKDIAAIGISNQRETTLLWDKQSGELLHKAIVWQDRRTTQKCQQLIQQNLEPLITEKTGLLLDPYFSASKLAWLLDTIPHARARAEKGELAFGTVDCFLLWRLTKGQCHGTDATNASRTLLFNIKTQQWDEELLKIFNIPRALLPTVYDNSAYFGSTATELFGANIPITSMAGDQQAAACGHQCFSAGQMKSTYGTGSFMLQNTGEQIIKSKNRLLTTVAYRLSGKTSYALEGSIFVAGAAVQWLRDAMHFINHADASETIAASITDNAGVYLVPAFTGLGAPYWDPEARGAILGLTRDTSIAHIVRATLEAVCYQTCDLLNAMSSDSQCQADTLSVDGGMVANHWFLQFLADILNLTIKKVPVKESSALGVAYLAGLHVGIFSSLADIQKINFAAETKIFQPQIAATQRERLYHGWKKAVERVCQK